MQLHALWQMRHDLLPDPDGQVLGAGETAFHKINIEVKVAVIQFFANLCGQQLAEFFGIHQKACFRIHISFYRDNELVVMAMPVGIGAFAEHFHIFLFCPGWVVELVRGIKVLVTSQVNHAQIYAKSLILTVLKTLIVAATPFELSGLCDHLKVDLAGDTGLFGSGAVGMLITGVGMVNTAYFMGRHATNRYDLLINAGVCGAFDRRLSPGQLVNVTSDLLCEMGAEDGDDFIPYSDMGLGGTNAYTAKPGSCTPWLNGLPQVKGITLNKVHGNENTIRRASELFTPQVESMEGAAFLRGCADLRGDYFQIRAVSNYVERRDKSKWQMPQAITALNEFLIRLIGQTQ